MSKVQRNSFIVSKALKTFVTAAVLTTAASQLAHTADSMIVGHVVGQDAVSAINLVLPLVEVLNCIGFLICFGANAMCAQAIGCNDREKVARTFTATLADIDAFLKRMKIASSDILKLNLCCEELMTNITQHSKGRVVTQTFDVHLHVNGEGVFVTLKDAGKPFDPIKAGKMANEQIGVKGSEHLGLRLVTHIIPDITYKYMYGQNTVFIWKKND